ncbi:MAG: hypothetical protein J6J42_00575 [Lachnospiraceae bacterium]|nr:hypothetical protein [Lachnospiraceae bacterium]
MAKDTSEVLASYMQILSNLIFAAERLSESEMAMIISSLNRWITKKDIVTNRSYGVGKIVQMEWGNNFSPELSYKHPAVIIEEWSNTVLVIPTTSTPAKVADSFHPIDNPTGKWYYRKVGTTEGFAHDCALILNNAKIMSKTRITSVSGSIAGNLNDDTNVFREIRKTMIKNFFSKEWIEYQKLVQAYKSEQEKNKVLQEAYDKLLEENNILKSSNNNIAAPKNEK